MVRRTATLPKPNAALGWFILVGGTGTFRGTVTKTNNGYRAAGTFTPINQPYNFDFWTGGTYQRAAITFGGYVLGVNVATTTRVSVVPQDYMINFNNTYARIDQR